MEARARQEARESAATLDSRVHLEHQVDLAPEVLREIQGHKDHRLEVELEA